jgi:hypothetical protein
MMIVMIMMTVAIAVIITATINTCRQVKCAEIAAQPSCNLTMLRLPLGETSDLYQGADRSIVLNNVSSIFLFVF